MEIRESIQKVSEADNEFGRMFCNHLLAHYPEVQKYFARVDLNRQSTLLLNALKVVAQRSIHPTRAMELYLEHLGTRHHDLQIPRELFGVWLKAMLESMERFHGSDWTLSLETHWRQAFEGAIEIMFRGYEERVRV